MSLPQGLCDWQDLLDVVWKVYGRLPPHSFVPVMGHYPFNTTYKPNYKP